MKDFADGAPDAIILKGLRARGFHGVLKDEKNHGQLFIADITLFLDLTPAGTHDALEKTVNYADVAIIVEDILSGKPSNLLETVALNIINTILSHFDVLNAVQATLHKPHAPIPTPYEDVSVTMTRKRASHDKNNGIRPPTEDKI